MRPRSHAVISRSFVPFLVIRSRFLPPAQTYSNDAHAHGVKLDAHRVDSTNHVRLPVHSDADDETKQGGGNKVEDDRDREDDCGNAKRKRPNAKPYRKDDRIFRELLYSLVGDNDGGQKKWSLLGK